MRTGMIVLAVFAAAWAVLGLLLAGSDPRVVVLPILVSIVMIGWSWHWSGLATSRGSHVGKLVGRWSAIEGVAIIVVGNLLQHFHRPDLVVPAAIIIIGLHFFPLARGIPVRLYHATGAAFLLLGLSVLLLPAHERDPFACFGAALILWSTVILSVLQIRRTAVSTPR